MIELKKLIIVVVAQVIVIAFITGVNANIVKNGDEVIIKLNEDRWFNLDFPAFLEYEEITRLEKVDEVKNGENIFVRLESLGDRGFGEIVSPRGYSTEMPESGKFIRGRVFGGGIEENVLEGIRDILGDFRHTDSTSDEISVRYGIELYVFPEGRFSKTENGKICKVKKDENITTPPDGIYAKVVLSSRGRPILRDILVPNNCNPQ